MKLLKTIVLVLVIALSFSSFSINKASANEISKEEEQNIVEEANKVAEQYGLTPVSEDEILNDQMLNFDSVEEFEEFLKQEQEQEGNGESNFGTPMISLMAAGGTKTYSYRESNATGSITSYARVTRNTKGVVSKVNIWSEQTGLVMGITWTQNTTWHNLNSTKKGGKAYVRGTKLYGANVVGQTLGYSKSVTYTVNF
ncbi:hypothetical protein AB9M93_05420 [Peribacillus frigoritolerans]|uniref:hypothetical protein n=1 Tax=Peribacillus frigoritolerans TaxID=450367 RepID=UPI0035191F29